MPTCGPTTRHNYHQQYLVKVPNGYCPLHATGVAYSG